MHTDRCVLILSPKAGLKSFTAHFAFRIFKVLLCFPVTETDKDQMNQGILVKGQNERKKENDYDL